MPKSREKKEEIVQKVIAGLKNAPSTVFVIQDKLEMNDLNKLRKELKSEQVELVSVKKTLLKLALKDSGLAVPVDEWDRTIAVAFGSGDAIAPARLLHKFAKDHTEQIVLKGGVLEGAYVNEAQVNELAMLPSRQELLAKTVYVLQAPITGFARVLAGNLRGLVQTLKAISEKSS
ncbi:MAG: 50S ribosomal protein L10 [Patescibacteria group bacterium]|jgi:large subunit ribosomal protein L10